MKGARILRMRRELRLHESRGFWTLFGLGFICVCGWLASFVSLRVSRGKPGEVEKGWCFFVFGVARLSPYD
jgi:hypothetical protein